MKKNKKYFSTLVLLCLSLSPLFSKADLYLTSQFYEQEQNSAKLHSIDEARAYVIARSNKQWTPKNSTWHLDREKQTTYFKGYRFLQYINQYPIYGTAAIVWVYKSSGKVSNYEINAYRHTHNTPLKVDTFRSLSKMQTLTKAWNELRPTIPLYDQPTQETFYFSHQDRLVLVDEIKLSFQHQDSWAVIVDTNTGQILKKTNLSIKDFKQSEQEVRQPRASLLGMLSLEEELNRLEQEKGQNDLKFLNISNTFYCSLKAEVLKQDPYVALNKLEYMKILTNNEINNAREPTTLWDLRPSIKGCFLESKNLKVNKYINRTPYNYTIGSEIAVLEADQNYATNSVEFLGLTAYYHLQNAQAYAKKLGYLIPKLKAFISNETYTFANYPYTQITLTYLTGEEKDARLDPHAALDPAVVLHEYAHLLTHKVNQNFYHDKRKGDVGAISEGFADYWGASYSYMMKPNYFDQLTLGDPSPTETGTHPLSLFFYVGRYVNADFLTYDPSNKYTEHKDLYQDGRAYQSDELWATALMTVFKKLLLQGASKQDFDHIVLDAMAKLDQKITMPHLARLTLEQAKLADQNNRLTNVRYFAAFQQVFDKHHFTHYKEQAELSLSINKKNAASDFIIDHDSKMVTYTGNESISRNAFNIEGGNGSGEKIIQLSYAGKEVFEITRNGHYFLTLTKAYTKENWESKSIQYEIKVNSFLEPSIYGSPLYINHLNPISIIYDGTAKLSTQLEFTGHGNGELSYRIQEDDIAKASVTKKGVLKIDQPGTYQLEVTRAASEGWKQTSSTFTIEAPNIFSEKRALDLEQPYIGDWSINRDIKELSYRGHDPIEIKLQVSGGNGDGALSFELLGDVDSNQVSLSKDGLLNIKANGEYNIRINQAASKGWKAISETFKLKVNQIRDEQTTPLTLTNPEFIKTGAYQYSVTLKPSQTFLKLNLSGGDGCGLKPYFSSANTEYFQIFTSGYMDLKLKKNGPIVVEAIRNQSDCGVKKWKLNKQNIRLNIQYESSDESSSSYDDWPSNSSSSTSSSRTQTEYTYKKTYGGSMDYYLLLLLGFMSLSRLRRHKA